jgi:hypothetical protein
MSTNTCNWWTACADDVFNSQQGRCEMQTKQDLFPTNVNMYRVARKRRKPKNRGKKIVAFGLEQDLHPVPEEHFVNPG